MKPNYRRCISCRRVAPKPEFWRIVRLFPDRTVQLDQGAGRAAYLCPTADCLHLAQKKNRLGRSLKAAVPNTIYEELGQRLSSTNTASPPNSVANPSGAKQV
ncbi:YlxR family protein [Oculatella sp. LEGE 06141]|uniref:YlxR family protein n=1 Tax=Oculatella sp. LEGE 06141 TaxID=1828648 RepID=UPI0018827AEC|nr:YlxR family protein [Oculatella sp. LEGE 06141]MBE9177662.1 YlxR family protein [Oculatella sp. LEGE 06141]